MAQFHFIEDYEKFVNGLVATYPIEEAMSIAVGGQYERIGRIENNILRYAGLRDGMSVFDLGCGSGRLAWAIAESGIQIDYIGTDVVQTLLDHAKTKTPAHYRFLRHPQMSVPASDASVDIACAFSVFTHLLQAETYLYLQDMKRALKPGGAIVFSFLEFAAVGHWSVFSNTVEQQRNSTTTQLNAFIERGAIDVWARHLELQVVEYIDGSRGVGGGEQLGQSTVILRKLA